MFISRVNPREIGLGDDHDNLLHQDGAGTAKMKSKLAKQVASAWLATIADGARVGFYPTFETA